MPQHSTTWHSQQQILQLRHFPYISLPSLHRKLPIRQTLHLHLLHFQETCNLYENTGEPVSHEKVQNSWWLIWLHTDAYCIWKLKEIALVPRVFSRNSWLKEDREGSLILFQETKEFVILSKALDRSQFLSFFHVLPTSRCFPVQDRAFLEIVLCCAIVWDSGIMVLYNVLSLSNVRNTVWGKSKHWLNWFAKIYPEMSTMIWRYLKPKLRCGGQIMRRWWEMDKQPLSGTMFAISWSPCAAIRETGTLRPELAASGGEPWKQY